VLHVRIENSQRIWMRNWCRQGGPGWWLTHVVPNGWWLLTGGAWGADSLGFASLETVVFNSQPLHDTRGLNYERLIRHLTKRG
jgi:hypothetical protein